MRNTFKFNNNNNIYESKNNEESDYIEDIDVGDEKPREEEDDDIRCTHCCRTFPTVQQFLQHRDLCSDGQISADRQPASGLNTFKTFTGVAIIKHF